LTVNFTTGFVPITITGQKFEDHDGNGVRGGLDQGLAGWTVFADANNDGVLNNPVSGNGVCDASAVERCGVTDSSGDYSISGVGAGTYKVREVPQAGWVQTTPNPPDIVASSGVDVSGVDFGNFKRIA